MAAARVRSYVAAGVQKHTHQRVRAAMRTSCPKCGSTVHFHLDKSRAGVAV